MRITLVEDNAALALGIRNALDDHGHAVNWLADGTEADQFLTRETADLIIMDVNLPGLSGFDLVRLLRRRGTMTPVIMLTARSELVDRVMGLDAGADDYLVKPFDMSELLARIRALSRRRPNIQPSTESIGGLTLDRAGGQLAGPQGTIPLSRRELALFIHLTDMQGRIASKEYISETLYGVGSEVEPNAVELLISRLRRKIEGQGVAIRTLRGLGYMLETAAP